MSLTSVTRELKHNGACTDTLEITYKIEDPCGNFTKVYQRQRIHDSLAPVALYKDTIYAAAVACVSDTVHAEANFIAVNALGYGLTDCNTMTLTSVARSLKHNGACTDTLVITYTIEDACHNIKQVYQLQRIHDSLAPAWNGSWPADITNVNSCVDDSLKNKLYTNEQVKALFSDCNSFTVDSVITTINNNCGWTVTKTFTVKDQCGNIYYTDGISTLPKQSVSGSDNSAPVLAGIWPEASLGQNACLSGANTSVFLSNEEAKALFTDCSAITVSHTQDTIVNACDWTIRRMYVIEDACGKTVKDTIKVSGRDNTAPVLAGAWPNNVTGQNACLGGANTSIFLSDDAAKELFTDCSEITVTHTQDTIIDNCDWMIRRMYVIADACGNEVKDTLKVSGRDITAPVLIAPDTWPANPADQNNCLKYADISGLKSAAEIASLYTDCSNVIVTYVQDTTGNSCSWTITRSYTIKDSCGNTVTPVPTMRVSGNDNVKPTISGTLPMLTVTGCSQTVAPAAYASVAAMDGLSSIRINDNCSDLDSLSLSYNDMIQSLTCVIVIKRLYTIEDKCSNKDTVSQRIEIHRDSSFTISGVPTDTNVYCESAAIEDNITKPVVTDACDIECQLVGTPVVTTHIENCTGTKAFTYTYRNCENKDTTWTFTYHIALPNVIAGVPKDTSDVVSCLEDARAVPPASILDQCGRTIVPEIKDTLVVFDYEHNTGRVEYRYTYKDCAGHDSTYTLTRYVIPGSFTAELDDDTLVHCLTDVVEPVSKLPMITNCGSIVAMQLVSTSGTGSLSEGCGDSTYTYKYEVNGTEYLWHFVYRVSPLDYEITAAPGRDTVSCPEEATIDNIVLPVVTDACGKRLTPVDTTRSALPSCEGNVVYTFKYQDCAGHNHNWTHTYRVENPELQIPATGRDTVVCLADTVRPIPATLTDACGREVTATINGSPVLSLSSDGHGSVTFNYLYRCCAGHTHPWQFIYTIEPEKFVEVPNGDTTVHCAADIFKPATPVVDVCGKIAPFTFVDSVDNTEGCGNRVYNYRYTVNDTVHTWKYTYTISPEDFTVPEFAEATVNCLYQANVAGITMPVVTDACGKPLTPGEVSIDSTDFLVNGCEGAMVFSYPYQDCAGHEKVWKFTYHIQLPEELANVPANGGRIVPCLVDVVAPGAATITDICGNTVTSELVGSDTTLYENGTGTVHFYYKYKDCAGHDSTWTYTYTLNPDSFTPEVDSVKQIACLRDTVTPQTPIVKDCGNVVPVVYDSVHVATTSCDSAVYYYHYRVRGVDYVWKYTYKVKPLPFSIPADSVVKVQCVADAVTPIPPVVTNSCDTVIVPVLTDKDSLFDGCEGRVIYSFTYTDCAGYNQVWKLTYQIKDTIKPAFKVPADIAICRQIDHSYNADTTVTGRPTLLSDNCWAADSLEVTYSDVATTNITVRDTITRTWKVADKCNDTVQVQHIFINPSYDLTEKDTICQLAEGDTWAWRDTTFAAGTVSGNYVFHRTTINGCDSVVTLQLTVKDTVRVLASMLTQEVCVGNPIVEVPIEYHNAALVSTDLTANGLILTQHHNGNDTVKGTIATPGEYSYTITATSTNGCGSTDKSMTVSVTVKDTVKLTIEPEVQTLCLGQNITPVKINYANGHINTLTLTSGLSITAPDGTDTISGAPTTAGTYVYEVTASSDNNCSAYNKIKTITIVVNDTLAPTLTSNSPVCLGNPVTVSETAGNRGDYTYSVDYTAANGSPANSPDSTVTVTYPAVGSYNFAFVITHNTTHCVSHISTSVNVMDTLVPVVMTNSANATVCLGEPVTVSETAGNKSGYHYNISYTKADGTTTDAYTDSTVTVTYTTAGVYAFHFTLTNVATGCESHVVKMVTVNDTIVPNLVTNSPVCLGNPVTVSDIAGNKSGYTYLINYTKADSVTPGDLADSTVTVNYIKAGNYQFSYTLTNNATQCVSHATTSVTVTDTLVPTLVTTSPVCLGDPVTVSETAGNKGRYYYAITYSGTPDVTDGAVNDSTITLLYAAVGNYEVNFTMTDNVTGCVGRATTTVTVNSLPVVSLSNKTICVGTDTKLTAVVSGGAAPYSYLWPDGGTNVDTTVSPAATTSYTVSVTNANGCTNSASAMVTVNDTLVPVLTSNTPVCLGNDVVVSETAGNLSDYSYNISYTGNPVMTGGGMADKTISLRYPAAGDYSVMFAVEDNLTHCVSHASQAVTVNDTARLAAANLTQAICLGNAITAVPIEYSYATISVSPELPEGLTMTHHGLGKDTIFGTPVAFQAASDYIITATNADGCANKSLSFSLTVNDTVKLTVENEMQVVCLGEAIEPIAVTYANATIAALPLVNGLGITTADGTDTISGTPALSGIYNYTITAVSGQGCASKTHGMQLTVNPRYGCRPSTVATVQ